MLLLPCSLGPPPVAEEIKGLLAALQPSGVALPAAEEEEEEEADTAAEPLAEVPPAFEQQTSLADLDAIEEGPLPVPGPIPSLALEEEEEEEAQLLLAIQQSMDSARQEVEELARATELSLRSFEQEQPPSPDVDILSVMRASLEAAAATRLQVYTALEEDAEAVVQELERALGMQLREEMVQNEALLSLPALCLDYLTYLERKHAVSITLAGPVATVSGFLDYPVAATRDLALLLARLLHVEVAMGCGDARWVRWEPSEQGFPTPYSAQASALLEQAWCRGHKSMEVFFDGRPFAVDFERMEEYDVGNGRTLPIGRTELQLPLTSPGRFPAQCAPPTHGFLVLPLWQHRPPWPCGVPPPGLGEGGQQLFLHGLCFSAALLDPPAEGEVKLLPLAEDAEEFQRTIQGFYDTLAGLHGKLWIVKVAGCLRPLQRRGSPCRQQGLS